MLWRQIHLDLVLWWWWWWFFTLTCKIVTAVFKSLLSFSGLNFQGRKYDQIKVTAERSSLPVWNSHLAVSWQQPEGKKIKNNSPLWRQSRHKTCGPKTKPVNLIRAREQGRTGGAEVLSDLYVCVCVCVSDPRRFTHFKHTWKKKKRFYHLCRHIRGSVLCLACLKQTLMEQSSLQVQI